MKWPQFSHPVVAVVVIERAEDAVPLARALVAGGITAIEVTMRTDAALDAIAAIAATVPEAILGAGTVLQAGDIAEVVRRGARFAVAPGVNPAVVAAAQSAALPFAPGVATPTDIELALSLGCTTLKFFPATALGGVKYLAAVSAPYNHLGVRFMPTGGVSVDTMGEWLANDRVVAVGGTWLARSADITAGAWDAITRRAEDAVSRAGAVRPSA